MLFLVGLPAILAHPVPSSPSRLESTKVRHEGETCHRQHLAPAKASDATIWRVAVIARSKWKSIDGPQRLQHESLEAAHVPMHLGKMAHLKDDNNNNNNDSFSDTWHGGE